MSTISPGVTRGLAARLAERGIAMLDAPVSGGSWGARQGTLTIMAGGEQTVFERCLPVFEAMGKSINLMGPSGEAAGLGEEDTQVLIKAVEKLAGIQARQQG